MDNATLYIVVKFQTKLTDSTEMHLFNDTLQILRWNKSSRKIGNMHKKKHFLIRLRRKCTISFLRIEMTRMMENKFEWKVFIFIKVYLNSIKPQGECAKVQ